MMNAKMGNRADTSTQALIKTIFPTSYSQRLTAQIRVVSLLDLMRITHAAVFPFGMQTGVKETA